MKSQLNITLAVIALSGAAILAPSHAQPTGNAASTGAANSEASVNNRAGVNAQSSAVVVGGSASTDTTDHSITGYGGTRMQDLLNDASEPPNVASIPVTNVKSGVQSRGNVGGLPATQGLNRAQ